MRKTFNAGLVGGRGDDVDASIEERFVDGDKGGWGGQQEVRRPC